MRVVRGLLGPGSLVPVDKRAVPGAVEQVHGSHHVDVRRENRAAELRLRHGTRGVQQPRITHAQAATVYHDLVLLQSENLL
jgi:hypothetical protein